MKRLLAYGLIALFSALTSTAFAKNRVGEITEEETRKIERRVEARNYTYFAFGPGMFTNMENDQAGQYVQLGYIWEATPYAAVKLTGEGGFNFEEGPPPPPAKTLGFSVCYPLLQKNFVKTRKKTCETLFLFLPLKSPTTKSVVQRMQKVPLRLKITQDHH